MSFLPGAAISSGGYNLNNSVRIRSSATAFLSRTPATSGNRTTWTWSAWVKRGVLGTEQFLFTGGDTDFNDNNIRFNADNTLVFENFNGSNAIAGQLYTTRVFRDPSAWYHIVAVWNTTTATAADRMQLWVNGVRETAFNTNTAPAQNQQSFLINNNSIHNIGRKANGATAYFDGYLTEVNFIDGQALSAASFGITNAATGVWEPARYTGTYGTNGFYLPFTDNTGTPLLVNTTSAVQNTAATTIPINVPTGTVNGDLMILFVASSNTANSWTTPAGWTVWSANFNGRAIYYRTASSEPASYTITQSGSSTSDGYILTYRFATFDVMGSYGSAGNPSVAPSITTTANNAIVFYSVVSGGQAGATYTTPSGFTPLVSDSDGTTPSSAIFSRVQATAGATGTASSTPSAGNPVSLQFAIRPSSPGATLGRDYSGNNNTWATNNISLTLGTTYDSMTDVPTLTTNTTANYCVLNTLNKNASLSPIDGNLNINIGVNNTSIFGTMGMSSGKWYWEVTCTSITATAVQLGIATAAQGTSAPVNGPFSWTYAGDGLRWNNSVGTAYGASFATGDVIGIAFDADIGSLTFFKNNVSQGVAFSSLVFSTYFPYFVGAATATSTIGVNFGQRPFVYTPPTGFNRLNTFNLPTSTIIKGNTVMDATLWAGNNATPRSFTNAASFRPDFVWIKNRTTVDWHGLYDVARGGNNVMYSNTTAAQQTNEPNGYLSAFNSNGFTVVNGASTANNVNATGSNYVGWQWQAASSAVTNTSGTISAQVRANTTAGFSIVTYTGNGGATASVGHGLGVAPKVVLIKSRSTTGNWTFFTTSIDGSYDYLILNLTDAKVDSTATAPTSSVFNLITAGSLNTNAVTYVAYCWAEIAGFSSIGSYTGNGSSDGPFVYTGFRPKYLLVKNASAAQNWNVYDSTRDPFNVVDLSLQPNLAAAEFTEVNYDFVSNGFKVRTTNAGLNGNGNTIIYMAFAENPFKNALAR